MPSLHQPSDWFTADIATKGDSNDHFHDTDLGAAGASLSPLLRDLHHLSKQFTE
jgi:hypothetical protein